MNKNTWMTIIAVAVVFGGGGFWGGMGYASAKVPTSGQFGAGGGAYTGTRGATGGAGRMNGVVGTIVAKDSSSLTVQLGGPSATSTNGASSGTRIVFYSGSTQVDKYLAGSASDLTIGGSVIVAGTPNSDGSITASMIQLRPAGTGANRLGQ